MSLAKRVAPWALTVIAVAWLGWRIGRVEGRVGIAPSVLGLYGGGGGYLPGAGGGGGAGDITSVAVSAAPLGGGGTSGDVTIDYVSTGCLPGESWTYDGATWACTNADPISEGWVCRDEFLGVPQTTTSGSCSAGLLVGSTLGYASSLAPTPEHPGIIAAAADAVNDRVAIVNNGSNVPGISLGTGANVVYEAIFQVSDLSDGTDTYWIRLGFIDTVTADQVDGVYFEYDSTADASFSCKTAANSVRTTVDSTIDVAADTWYHLRVEVDAATTARFYINGTQRCGDVTTNIPTGVGRETGYGFAFFKSVGTTARSVFIDVLEARGHFSGGSR